MTLFDNSLPSVASDGVVEFRYGGSAVRTVRLADDAPWFVVADVCRALHVSEPSGPLSRVHKDDRRRLRRSDTPELFGGIAPQVQELNVVNESGLYDLIIESRTSGAREFRRWITSEVLPSIHRTGTYSVPAPRDELDELEVAERYVAALKRNRELEQANAELAPAADAWAKLADAQGDMLVADAAKILDRDPTIETGQKRLFATLLNELHWCYRGSDGAPRAMQDAVDLGRLTEKPQYRYNSDGERILAAPQVRVTVKGLHDLHKRLKGSQPLAIEPARTAAAVTS